MNTRLLYSLLLAFALLFAQQGAALHTLSHFADETPAHSEQEKHLPHFPACDKCIAYAAVGSAAAPSPLAFDGQTGSGIFIAATLFPVFSTPLHAYRSRAPPRSI